MDECMQIVWDHHRGAVLHHVHRHPVTDGHARVRPDTPQFLVTALHVDEFRIVTASPDSPGTLCIVNYSV